MTTTQATQYDVIRTIDLEITPTDSVTTRDELGLCDTLELSHLIAGMESSGWIVGTMDNFGSYRVLGLNKGPCEMSLVISKAV